MTSTDTRTTDTRTTDLRATVRLEGDDSDTTIDGYELFSARRALRLLKSALGRDGLLDLLDDEITAGEAFMRRQLELWAGEQATGTTTLRAHGINAAGFGAWLAASFGREDVTLAANPEHYVVHDVPGRPQIVETLGERVTSFFMAGWEESCQAQGRRSHLSFADGTTFGSVSTLFTDVPGGFTAVLSVTLPATCAPAVVDQHLEHFAVEFRSWILLAAEELGRD